MFLAKQHVAVRIATSGYGPVDGFFSLALPSRDLLQSESLLELLNSGERIIPFITDHGHVVLITRLGLDWVVAGDQVPTRLILPHDFVVVRHEPVNLCFIDGSTVAGAIEIESRFARSRLSDVLHGQEDFCPVLTRFGTLFVNKARMREQLAMALTNTAPGITDAGSGQDSMPHQTFRVSPAVSPLRQPREEQQALRPPHGAESIAALS